ncbi:MAG: hypothetical protein FWJ90_11920 [Actinomadura sp.]
MAPAHRGRPAGVRGLVATSRRHLTRGAGARAPIGLCTATTLLTIDVVYFARGQIKWTYLLDGVAEACWIAAWLRADAPRGRSNTPGDRLKRRR